MLYHHILLYDVIRLSLTPPRGWRSEAPERRPRRDPGKTRFDVEDGARGSSKASGKMTSPFPI